MNSSLFVWTWGDFKLCEEEPKLALGRWPHGLDSLPGSCLQALPGSMRPSLVSPAGPTPEASRRPSPLGQQPRAKAPSPRPPRPGQALLRAVSRPPPQMACRPHRPKPAGLTGQSRPASRFRPCSPQALPPESRRRRKYLARGLPGRLGPSPADLRASRQEPRGVGGSGARRFPGSAARPGGRRYIEAGGRSWAQARRPIRSLSAPPARLTAARGNHQP